jgi:iron complex outermembrane recepter protein
MTRATLAVTLILASQTVFSQEDKDLVYDSAIMLNAITIRAYQHERKLLEIPASVGVITPHMFERYNNSSLLPVLNALPGVRMEERSPGSYRLSIRGSTLRSPFGLRNVKVYWNDLPFTDPGGNTYLNLLDFGSIQSAEVIRGPGGSLYGAGTGGVVLMRSDIPGSEGASVRFSAAAGSYGSVRFTTEAQHVSDKANLTIRYAHQQSDGYREQTNMTRDAIQLLGKFRLSDRRSVEMNMFYSDLFYETPGGLTQDQFNDNPRQARPAAGPNPGAVEQHAAVFNKTFYASFAHEYKWNAQWSNLTGIYGTFSQFDNPSIRNYEKRVELSLGGRTNTQFDFNTGKLDFGAEFQHGYSPINVYDNNKGQSGLLQNSDEIISTSGLIFAQLEFYLPFDFFLTLGGSMNFVDVRYERLSDLPPFHQRKNFDPVFSPRFALLKKFNQNMSAYGSISKGFSPPTVAELYPSTATFNDEINPEEGTNYEIGVRGNFVNNSIQLDIVVYDFQLSETIVVRRSADGADYFVNAGKTSQKGMEVYLSWSPQRNKRNDALSLTPWISYSLNHYRFSDYTQDMNDFSGNKLTGAPPNILVAGLDLTTSWGMFANISYTYTDQIPLDDGNTAFADPYSLLGVKLGYRLQENSRFPLVFFVGVDNIFDERYSLGNDLNAFGGRYFNPAMPVNFYFGIRGNINLTNPRRE